MSFPAVNLALKTNLHLTSPSLSLRWFTKHHIAFYFELFIMAIIGLALTFSVEATVNNTIVQPKVAATTPNNGYLAQDIANPISIEFTNPVNRDDVKVTFYPPVEGEMKFVKEVFGENFVREIIFQPKVTLKLNTNYLVKVSNIHSVGGFDEPYEYSFKFKTIDLP